MELPTVQRWANIDTDDDGGDLHGDDGVALGALGA